MVVEPHYYVRVNGTVMGPLKFTDLRFSLMQQVIDPAAEVQRLGEDTWSSPSAFEEFADLFSDGSAKETVARAPASLRARSR